jgi:hypothetical protein
MTAKMAMIMRIIVMMRPLFKRKKELLNKALLYYGDSSENSPKPLDARR